MMYPRARQGVDLTALPSWARGFYEALIEVAYVMPRGIARVFGGSASELHVDVVCTRERDFGARAVPTRRGHRIEFACALPCLLHFCFNNVLRLPTTLPALGAAGAEQRYSDAFPRGIPLSLPPRLSLTALLTQLPGVSRPIDDQRALAATALTEIASLFCIFHEIGHIVGGHTRYLSRDGTPRALSEARERGALTRSTRSVKLARVWEAEADIIGVTLLLNLIANDHATRVRFQESFEIDSGTDDDLLGIVAYALDILFLYMGQRDDLMTGTSPHPHPLVRFELVRQILYQTVTHDLSTLRVAKRKLRATLRASARDAIRAWSMLGLDVPAVARNREPRTLIDRDQEKLVRWMAELRPAYSRWAIIPSEHWTTPQAVFW